MIELDLSGRRLAVAEDDLAWLRRRADEAAGSSSAASELAGRLAAVTAGQRRLVLFRAEARTLLNLIRSADELPPGLSPLHQVLQQMFPPSLEPT